MKLTAFAAMIGCMLSSAALAQTPSSPLNTISAPRGVYAPDVATVTIGGTAITAFTAGHTLKGGWIQNPSTATANMCISQTGAAASTSAADVTGGTSCIVPGQTYTIAPSYGSVSVNSTDSGHQFSGQGFY